MSTKQQVQLPITYHDLAKLKLTPRPFSRAGWIFEFKYDGFRVLAGYAQGKPQLVSRNGTDLLPSFPEIGRQLQLLDVMQPIVLDGELTIVDKDGRPQFDRLRRRFATKRPINVAHAARNDPAVLFAFDLLVVGGGDVRNLQLLERKEMLDKSLDGTTQRILQVKHYPEKGEALFKMAEALRIEGIVAKLASSPYRSGYGSGWLKVKTAHGRASDAERRKWNE